MIFMRKAISTSLEMRNSLVLLRLSRHKPTSIGNLHPAIPNSVPGRRHVQTNAIIDNSNSVDSTIQLPSAPSPQAKGLTRNPDASFQVLGSPFSLLSVNLSPSQPLYTRRGTLIGLSGAAENVISSLSVLSPIQRLPFAVPFLYQKVTSTSPINAIIGTNSTSTSLSTINLDGRSDWVIAQRNALLAWSGHALTVKPKMNAQMSPSQWGNSLVTGRGLVAVVGRGQIYQVNLKEGDEYVVHPKHVVAYTSTDGESPAPFRFRSNPIRLQIPSISSIFPDTRFFMEMRKTAVWKTLASVLYTIRTWTRRSIFGDRLFLHFQGPVTLLVQSRGSSIVDSLTTQEINEIADVPAGSVQTAFNPTSSHPGMNVIPNPKVDQADIKIADIPTVTRQATVGADGKFKIQ